MDWTEPLVGLWRALIVPRVALAAENLALRQQLAVFKRDKPRPKLKRCDHWFWIILAAVARLAVGAGHRVAGDGMQVASRRIPKI